MSSIRLDIDGSERAAARRRTLARGAGLAAAAVLVLGGGLPWLASTGAGNALVLRALNARIAGTVAVDSAETGWLGGTRVRGLRLLDPEGATVVRGLDADADTGFAGLLLTGWRGGWPVLDAAVRVTEVDLRRSGAGELNLGAVCGGRRALPTRRSGRRHRRHRRVGGSGSAGRARASGRRRRRG